MLFWELDSKYCASCLAADKFTSEVDVDRQKFELLLAEKNEQEMEYEEKLKQADERSQVQLQALDTQYQVCRQSPLVSQTPSALCALKPALLLGFMQVAGSEKGRWKIDVLALWACIS